MSTIRCVETGSRVLRREELHLWGREGFGFTQLLRLSLPVVALLLPLVVVPGLPTPFSLPKLIAWVIVVVVGLVICLPRLGEAWEELPSAFRVSLACWLSVVGASAAWSTFASLESLLLPLAGVGWLVLLAAVRPRSEHMAWMLVWSGSVVAGIGLAQFFHLDPFTSLGWIPIAEGSARMRVFSTLGNPNFVATFLSGVLPITFFLAYSIRKRRRILIALLALQSVTIIATGSRAPVLALIATALWVASLQQHKSWRTFGLIALCVVAMAAAFSPARDMYSTFKGRIYIWKISAPHITQRPVVGLGPGGFGASFASWEIQYWQVSPDEHDRKFVGIEDHAHNDYLEIAADYGVAGLFAFLAVLAASLRTAWLRARTSADPLAAGASAGVIALAAVAMVDFPLMRPAESFLLWSLIAISLLSSNHASRLPRGSTTILKGE